MSGRQGGKLSSTFVQHEPVDVFFDEPSRTRQEFADECDINVLMRRYEATGVISHMNQREPMYVDLSELPDLQGALNIVRGATEAFMSLPASVRAEFDNNAVAWANYASDPKNMDQMVAWGLAEKVKVPAPQKVEVVNPPAAPSPASAPLPGAAAPGGTGHAQ